MMRITIDTDELARTAGTLGAVPADLPVLDAGAAPIEHIQRMIGARAAAASADGGASNAPRNVDLLDARGLAATDPPLNPLRAGAPVPAAATDGGRAAHATGQDAPASEAAGSAAPTRKPRSTSKPRRKA